MISYIQYNIDMFISIYIRKNPTSYQAHKTNIEGKPCANTPKELFENLLFVIDKYFSFHCIQSIRNRSLQLMGGAE